MFFKIITSMLLATTVFASLQTGTVMAATKDTTVRLDSVKNEAHVDLELANNNQENHLDSIEKYLEAFEAELEEGRTAASVAADAAAEAADEARDIADDSDGQAVSEAADTAAFHAEKAKAVAELAAGSDDSFTIGLAVETAEASQAAAEKAAELTAAKASEAAAAEVYAKAAEEAAQEAERLASAEYLGHFTLTAYCHCARCCGRAGAATASGVMPKSGHTVAMSGLPFGSKLLINGVEYTVEDLGTPYGHVDIFMDSHEEALQFGMQSADVYLLKD